MIPKNPPPKNIAMVFMKDMRRVVSATYKIIWQLMRLRQMESELIAQQTSQQLRLTRYREVYYKATWMELEIKE